MSNPIKIKVMKNKPKISGEEIRSHMDFDKLLQQSKTINAQPVPVTIRSISSLAIIVPAAIALLAVAYWLTPKSETSSPPTNIQEPPISIRDTTLAKKDALGQQTKGKTAQVNGARSGQIKEGTKGAKSQRQTTVSAATFIEAEPIDGYPALYEYFSKELKYPSQISGDSIEGVTTVSFFINEKGRPAEIKIVNSLGKAFDEECIRVIENMPLWKPATIDGSVTPARLTMPLTFRIKKG
jgi:TonB family protein